jgi:hypothetical protein
MKLKLSRQWTSILDRHGETGMGYVVVSVVLKDGRRFDRVCVAWDTIAAIAGLTDVPFSDDDIADLIVTHDRTGRHP